MRLSPTMAELLNMLNDNAPLAVVCSSERYQLAAEALREAGYVKIEGRMVPRFPDNGRNIWTLQQQQLRVCAYYVTFTDAGRETYGASHV